MKEDIKKQNVKFEKFKITRGMVQATLFGLLTVIVIMVACDGSCMSVSYISMSYFAILTFTIFSILAGVVLKIIWHIRSLRIILITILIFLAMAILVDFLK